MKQRMCNVKDVVGRSLAHGSSRSRCNFEDLLHVSQIRVPLKMRSTSVYDAISLQLKVGYLRSTQMSDS